MIFFYILKQDYIEYNYVRLKNIYIIKNENYIN